MNVRWLGVRHETSQLAL